MPTVLEVETLELSLVDQVKNIEVVLSFSLQKRGLNPPSLDGIRF
ncbi:hypothetical protein [Sporolactobacillus pectinivorans]|nr:hypothetical protein [Sporolactobacillus pectinivorans]